MFAFVLAFASSVSWGTADFLGGIKSRQLPLLNVLVASQGVGLALIAMFVVVRGDGPPAGQFALWAALSGLAGVVGLAAFYRGLAVGNMGVVAPISATSAVIPVVVGIATGDRPAGIQIAGLGLALGGVVLASREEVEDGGSGGRMARGAGLAIVSAIGFGLFFLAMDRASDGDVGWAIFINRITGFSLLLAIAVALHTPVRAGRADAAALAAVGGLDIAANALFAVAATKGLISLVAVLGSLYPVTTIALARVILGERAHALAQVGVVAVLCGVVLIVAG